MAPSSDNAPSPQERAQAREQPAYDHDEEGFDEGGNDPGEQAEFEATVVSIGQKLAEGQSQESIVDQIVGDDADEESRHNASELVFQIANTLAESEAHHDISDDSGVASWMIWIGLLVLINILSAAFDWGFWIY